MSGQKISLDELGDKIEHRKAKIVFKEVEIDDLPNDYENGHVKIINGTNGVNGMYKKSVPRNGYRSDNGSDKGKTEKKERIVNMSETTLDAMMDMPEFKDGEDHFNTSVTINRFSDTSRSQRISERDSYRDSSGSRNSYKKKSRKKSRKKSTRKLEEAIKNALHRHKSSSRSSDSERVSDTRTSNIKITSPYTSEEARVERKQKLQNKVEAEETDIDMTPETDIEKITYYLTKFKILKENFPDVAVPRINVDGSFKDNINIEDDEDKIPPLSWQSMRKMYIMELDRVSIGKNVETYKLVMIVLFFITEYIGSRFLKVDITGYTVHSLRSMHRYQRLLIELGEKDYSSFGADWPVEVRILGLMVVNSIIFVIAKTVYKITGNDMSDEFFKLFDQLGSQSVEEDISQMPESVGMDSPAPGNKGEGGGLMGMLSGVLGGLTGGSSGGGGLGSILSGLMGGGGGGSTTGEATTSRGKSRVKRPTYRRKKKKKR